MKKVSVKQLQVLEAIEYYIKENDISPTYREIADLLECDVRQVFEKILILEKKGYLSTKNGKARSIRVLKGLDEL